LLTLGRICALISAGSAGALILYLFSLAHRTSWFERTAAVGGDVVAIVAIVNIVAVITAIVAKSHFSDRFGRWLLLVSLALFIAYFLLYVVGKFGPVAP